MIENAIFRQVGRQQPAVVHLDLDGATHIYRVHGWSYDRVDDPLFYTGLRHAIDLFGDLGVVATLFVIAEDLDDPRKRELILEAADHGHEIASHSLTHRRLLSLSPDEQKREISGSRQKIFDSIGIEVAGFRAPALDIDTESLELVAAAGYAYDSSLFGYRRHGASANQRPSTMGPHPILTGRSLQELPLPRYSPLPVPFHPSYSLTLGMWYFRLGLSQFRRLKAPLVLLLHLTDLAEPLPSDYLPHQRARLFTLSHRSGPGKRQFCRRVLEKVKDEFKLGTTMQLLRRR